MRLLSLDSRTMMCSLHGEQIEKGVNNRWFGCPACNASTAALKENIQDKASIRDNVARIGLPKMYSDVAFRGWVKTDDRQIEVLKKSRSYAEALCKSLRVPNLVLSGNTGTGKTHLAACIAKYVANRQVRCTYLPSASFMAEIRLSWDYKLRTRPDFEILADYGSLPVLILDELGIRDSAKSQHDIWSALFDQRYRDLLPTIITTNLTREELKVQIGDRAFDRLMQNCIWMDCIWLSYRQIISNVETVRG